jgi:MoaA/NifB/PqqE/SkfB family radical SAM enzyme
MSFLRKAKLLDQVKKRTLMPWERISTRANLTRFEEAAPEEVVDYRPVQLNVVCTNMCTLSCKMCFGHSKAVKNNYISTASTKEMDLETFQYVMTQMPTVQFVQFSGWGEPFLNSDLFEMVAFAYRYNGAVSTVVTNGLLIENRMESLLKSQLQQLVISINGYTPESYHQMTGMPADHFVTVKRNVERLVLEKKRLPKSKLSIELSFIIDMNNYIHMPQMLRLAQDLRVDGVRFENFLSPDPAQPSELSLYNDDPIILAFLDRIRPNLVAMNVTLPKLLDREMVTHRNCKDPFTTVTVDAECNVSACSRQWLLNGKMGKVWDQEFWNNDHFQWLRGVHGTATQEVPKPCQNCPNNCGAIAPPVKFT